MVEILFNIDEAAELAGVSVNEFFHYVGSYIELKACVDDLPAQFFYSETEIEAVKQKIPASPQ